MWVSLDSTSEESEGIVTYNDLVQFLLRNLEKDNHCTVSIQERSSDSYSKQKNYSKKLDSYMFALYKTGYKDMYIRRSQSGIQQYYDIVYCVVEEKDNE